jgi:hypothetical protein
MPIASDGVFNKNRTISSFARQVGFTLHDLTSDEGI